MEQNDLLINDFTISATAQINLVTAAKWGKFLAIVGFIFCALMLFGGLASSLFLSSSFDSNNSSLPFMKYAGVIYIVMAVALFLPCLYLMKFSTKMLEAVKSSNQESLDVSIANLKSMFKFYGIFILVILGIYALVIIFFIAATLAR
jgi:hypothetical protein